MVVGEFTVETDVAVIGGGLAGCETAIAAAIRGAKVTLIDEGLLSPDGLGGRWAKAGGAAARVRQHIAALGRHGADPAALRDMAATLVPRATADARASLARRLDDAGVTVVGGLASFDNARQLSIQDNPQVPRVRFRRAVIAVGTRADVAAHPWTTLPGVTSVGDADPSGSPDTLLLAGTGTALLEVAGLYRALGADVTWVTETDELLPPLGASLDALVQREMAERGVHVRTGTMIERMAEGHDGGLSVAWRDGDDRASFAAAIYAAVRRPGLDALHVERLQVEPDASGRLTVDEALRTTNPRVLAVGDAAAIETSAAAASVQARVAATTLTGGNDAYDVRATPVLARSSPPAGWCGITPGAAAADASLAVRVDDRAGTARAIVHERETGIVVGVAAFGPDAESDIARGVVAVEMGAVLDDLEGMAG